MTRLRSQRLREARATTQRSQSTTKSRSQPKPTMGRTRTRSERIRTAKETPKPRLKPSTPNSQKRPYLRTRFHRTGHRVVTGWRAKSGKSTTGQGYSVPSSFQAIIDFSGMTVKRSVPASEVGYEKMERWAAIAAGELPPDDDTPRPPTDEQIEQAEADAIEEIEAWGRQQEAQIRAKAESDADSIYGDETTGSARHNRARTASSIWRRAEQDIEEVGDQVREERAKARRAILDDAERKQEECKETIKQLRTGLEKEVKDVLNGTNYFEGSSNPDMAEHVTGIVLDGEETEF